jgi:hypothetical protein
MWGLVQLSSFFPQKKKKKKMPFVPSLWKYNPKLFFRKNNIKPTRCEIIELTIEQNK